MHIEFADELCKVCSSFVLRAAVPRLLLALRSPIIISLLCLANYNTDCGGYNTDCPTCKSDPMKIYGGSKTSGILLKSVLTLSILGIFTVTKLPTLNSQVTLFHFWSCFFIIRAPFFTLFALSTSLLASAAACERSLLCTAAREEESVSDSESEER